MLTACIVLAIMGAVGAFDMAYFHTYKAQLGKRPESRIEAWVHVVRSFVYAAQFALVPNVRLGGTYYFALVGLFVLDVAVAALDVAIEPASRRSQGGLPAGEYAAHVFLSVLAGVLLHAVFSASAGWHTLPTAIVLEPHAPAALRIVLGVMAAASLIVAVVGLLGLVEASLPKPRPIHVSVKLRASAQTVWDITQDHVEHPNWDHRFSRIIMLSDTIRTGTDMIYEKTICGITIRGWGRYKLHRPVKQSTFEFGSNDVRSLIRHGVGLWLYRPRPGGLLEFSTAYTYDVRWGLFGRLVDRLVVRPFFQRETERSFQRLAARHFPESA
ncbi:SRPBCC family protein [Pendulispora rubella]|uniref:SRPBCC family protein n=1 Tax=Pendulispora rubella TaxID=2741070 RepID=A0ABZ2KXM8_9BACT